MVKLAEHFRGMRSAARIALTQMSFGLGLVVASGVAFGTELHLTGHVDAPICDERLLTAPPQGFDSNVASTTPPRDCAFPRPPGHIVLLGPESRPVGGVSLATDDGRLSNLVVNNDIGVYCLPRELRSRPAVMGCLANPLANQRRPGLSRDFIPSLHDTETEIAQVSAIVDANDGAALITTAEFDIDRYSPQLGPDFDQEICRHFTLRIERGQMTGPPAPVVTDYPLDITAGRRNRIVASFPVTRQERITATLLFAPIPFRHAVSNGFHTDESTSIKLLISQTKLSFSRGLLPDSIFDAVRTGDLDGLRALLNGNADVTALDRSGLTALALARWMQKDDIAKELATRGAPDNRSAIIFGPAAGLINVLQNDVPPQAVVSDIMAQKVILRQPATQPGASDTGARKPMSFDVHASLEPDGCDRTEINFTSSASSRDDYQMRNIGCWADNPAAFIASYAPNTSIASFDAYRLATLSPNEPGTLGATVYTAHAVSGAYGAMRYSGTWPFGTTHERTARVSYTVKGNATIPACTDPGRCSVLQQIWFEERHQGDGFRTEVNVVQKGASPTPLTPGVPVQFDLSRGPVTIDLTLARDYSHLGAACCATLQQNQLVNVYAADTFRVQPSDSIMRGTHAPFKRPIGEEYLPLTLARIDAITQSAAAFTTTLMQLPGLPPAPQLDRRPSELALAQYHDDASHPHSARS